MKRVLLAIVLVLVAVTGIIYAITTDTRDTEPLFVKEGARTYVVVNGQRSLQSFLELQQLTNGQWIGKQAYKTWALLDKNFYPMSSDFEEIFPRPQGGYVGIINSQPFILDAKGRMSCEDKPRYPEQWPNTSC